MHPAAKEVLELVEEIAKKLARSPDKVMVLVRRQNRHVLLQVTVEEDDFGRLLGARGETASALRRIATAIAGKHCMSCEVNLGTYAETGKERCMFTERTLQIDRQKLRQSGDAQG